ncbi:YeeE/YedE thiosulfate transporter family protein [Pseudonocardia sp.]|uniref:YeeE/YedE family protein n=1 Tax=Pseudonocardia sp. TaxID=60912 RepID=UPI00260DF7AC|nr:YeeE/YedE thiosulfate transporter family protein [Pseudonocardia sp.]
MSSYWPWWAGAIGLALVTIAYSLATDRSFGVSGAWDRVLHWRAERDLERRRARDEVDQRALVDALAGHSPGDPYPVSPGPRHGAAANPPARRPPRPAPLVTQAALLVSILLGGFVAAATSGRFEVRPDMGPGFAEIVTDNPVVMVVVLFLGGLLVGFGTRLAGGCSSGHGLHGCGRLYPVSLVATAVFFGTAVVVSFLLWKVI